MKWCILQYEGSIVSIGDSFRDVVEDASPLDIKLYNSAKFGDFCCVQISGELAQRFLEGDQINAYVVIDGVAMSSVALEFVCDEHFVYRYDDSMYWYISDVDIPESRFDIRTIASYIVSVYEWMEPDIKERVCGMSHAEIFAYAYDRKIIRFVGAYVVPIKITINICNI